MINVKLSNGQRRYTGITTLYTAVLLTLVLAACTSGSQTPTTTSAASSTTQSGTSNRYGIAMRDGYQISLFARGKIAGDGTGYNSPDSAVVDGGHVFLDYQNSTAKDCTDNKTSTVVEYDMNGTVLKTYIVPGHSDGMRMDPSTKLLWASSCEDGNPKLVTIDPASGTVTPYAFPANLAHGGGFDDMYFLNGMTFITASNPNLDKNGVNVFPALYKISLAAGKAVLTPILMGNATVTDTTTSPPSKVTLNEIDPDSLSNDNKGNLVMVNQGGSELVTITNPGASNQTVTRTPVGIQLDDTVWVSSAKGRLLVVDGTTSQTYWLKLDKFTVGDVYTETPDDSGVTGVVGVVDLTTGFVAPVAIGFGKPTGMLFVPDSQS